MTTAHHPDRHNIDEFMQSAYPNHLGFAKQFVPTPIIVTDEGDLAFTTLQTGTNDVYGWKWNATGTTDDILVLKGQIPLDFNHNADKIKLRLWVRKFDTTGSASDNADLALTFSFIALQASGAAIKPTIANYVLPVDNFGTTLDDFTLVEIDLSGNDLRGGDKFSLAISVNEAVGTNLALDLLEYDILYWGSVSFMDRDLRKWYF